jgi:hypothetical protein
MQNRKLNFYNKFQIKNKQIKHKQMNNLQKFPRISVVLALFGVMSFLTALSSPSWVNIRGVDAVRLIGTGMCFGAAIISFSAYYIDRRSSYKNNDSVK